MTATATTDEQAAPISRWRIMAPVVFVALSAVALAAYGLYWATSRSDALSIRSQTRELRNAIKIGIDEVVQSQKMVAVWDQAVLELARPAPDWDWVDSNLGLPLRISFGHSQFYILDENDKPVYAMHEGVRVEPDLYELIKYDLKPLIDTVRGRAPTPAASEESIGLHPSFTARYRGGPLYAADLMSLFRRPAAVSVMRNAARTETIGRRTGKPPLIVSVRFLDSLFLQQLATRHLIEDPRFSLEAEPRNDEQMLPLVGHDGAQIGYMFWKPELPGTIVMRTLAPVIIVTIGMMMVIMTLLGIWLFRSIRQEREALDELREKEAQAQRLALHDALTALPNRIFLERKLDEVIIGKTQAALLLLDLDRFKNVNDTLGHPAGDMLIREFAQRLKGIVREKDTVARLGGDEFAILCVDSPPPIDLLSRRIVETVSRPFNLDGTDVFVGVSVGVCAVPAAGSDRIEILRKADIALYRAKAEGRNCYRIFTPAMDDAARKRAVLEGELRAALATGKGLVIHYQPQLRSSDHAVIGLEALLRWQHPVQGLIPPDQFITIAEETGLIIDLGEWVLREGCAASLRWPDLFIAINLSLAQLRMPGFAERTLEIVRQCGADPGRIELEVTETVFLDDDIGASVILEQLRHAGFSVALDDFGTGYSSLSYLRRFNVDKIKIDRSFIQHVCDDPAAAAIVTAVLTLGHALGLKVTAEGVETADQNEFLSAVGCDFVQGYLFSRPVPESELETIVPSPQHTTALPKPPERKRRIM